MILALGDFPMTQTVCDLLKVFDALPPAEQHLAATEILRRWMPDRDLPDKALDELAADLFRNYDAEEEVQRATP
jgi:hypothetical protein